MQLCNSKPGLLKRGPQLWPDSQAELQKDFECHPEDLKLADINNKQYSVTVISSLLNDDLVNTVNTVNTPDKNGGGEIPITIYTIRGVQNANKSGIN